MQGLLATCRHKIGCTTAVMQRYLGMDHPCSGAIFSQTVRVGDGSYANAALYRPGVECEIAVRLGSDIPPSPAGGCHWLSLILLCLSITFHCLFTAFSLPFHCLAAC